MNIRTKLGLAIFATGLATMLLVIASVVVAFERLRARDGLPARAAFLMRVAAQRMRTDILELQRAIRATSTRGSQNLVLFEPDSQLYLLDAEGRVLATTARIELTPTASRWVRSRGRPAPRRRRT